MPRNTSSFKRYNPVPWMQIVVIVKTWIETNDRESPWSDQSGKQAEITCTRTYFENFRKSLPGENRSSRKYRGT